jgi:hypothetical protein
MPSSGWWKKHEGIVLAESAFQMMKHIGISTAAAHVDTVMMSLNRAKLVIPA